MQVIAGPKKISQPGQENTQARPPHFLCPQVKKNPARSKIHVRVQKNDAKVQKTCIPIYNPIGNGNQAHLYMEVS